MRDKDDDVVRYAGIAMNMTNTPDNPDEGRRNAWIHRMALYDSAWYDTSHSIEKSSMMDMNTIDDASHPILCSTTIQKTRTMWSEYMISILYVDDEMDFAK